MTPEGAGHDGRGSGAPRALERGRPFRSAATALGWSDEYPDLDRREDGRGAQETYDPAITLMVKRWRCRQRYYHLDMRLIVRDDIVGRAIEQHYIGLTLTYIDREARRRFETRTGALDQEKRAGYAQQGLTYFLSPSWWWTMTKQVAHGLSDRGLAITVDDLLGDGCKCHAPTLEEAREIERAVLYAIDRINMAIEVGCSFDNAEEAHYGPGDKPKSSTRQRDDGTPPSEWT